MNDESFLQKLSARGNSYWLTRFVILRLLGFVYAVAFLVAAQQLVPLIGEHGLTPANHFLASVQTQLGSRHCRFTTSADALLVSEFLINALSIFAWIGFGLSLVVLGGYANAILLAVLWAIYMSIVHVGQIWYGYGWEIQLLETGFLSIFLCPLLDGRPFPEMQAADSRYLAFSMAWVSHHDRCRPDQTPRRPMLARSYLPLLITTKHSRFRVPSVAIFTLRRSGSRNSGRDGTISSNWSCRGFHLVHDTRGMSQASCSSRFKFFSSSAATFRSSII